MRELLRADSWKEFRSYEISLLQGSRRWEFWAITLRPRTSSRLEAEGEEKNMEHEGAIVGFVVIVVAVMVGIFAYDFISASSSKSGA